MAGKPISGDGLAPSLAGMSKTQLYDIMCQMKTLIEQNQAQARQILIDNPLLTRALFQAQIMLGMVQPPQAIPNILPQPPLQSQPPVQPSQLSQPVQPSKQSQQLLDQSLPSQVGSNDQRNVSKFSIPLREQQQKQYSMPVSSSSTQGLHSQPMPSHALLPPKGHVNAQGAPMPLSQTSQIPTMPSLPIHSGSQPSPVLQPPMPPQTTGLSHLAMQPPLLPQHRPPVSALPHQMQSHMGPNMNFQHPGIPPAHHSQPMYHSNIRPGMGPSFTHGQPQSLYQGPHLVTDFNNQVGNSMQMERGSPWPPIPPDGSQISGTPPMVPLQAGIGSQPARPPPLTPEMEQALLQQVMSLTPEQINLLPLEQRQQVLQLQQMLRQ